MATVLSTLYPPLVDTFQIPFFVHSRCRGIFYYISL